MFIIGCMFLFVCCTILPMILSAKKTLNDGDDQDVF